MKPSFFLYGTLALAFGTVLPVTSSLHAADAASSATGGRVPLDLARGSLGTRLQIRVPAGAPSTDLSRSAQALIGEDATEGYPLADGTTSIILSLQKIEVLNRFNFLNDGAAGEVSVAVTSSRQDFDGAGWRTVIGGQSFGGQGAVGCDLGSVEARYVKLTFQTKGAGRVAGLGLFGLPAVGSRVPQTGVAQVGGHRAVFLDYADLTAGAQVVGVSRGGQVGAAQSMLDANVETNYTFDPADPNPTVVVDLGARRTLSRVSCVYQAPAGRIDFFLVDQPYANDYQRVALNFVDAPTSQTAETRTTYTARNGDGARRQAICSAVTTGDTGVGRVAADFGGASGRYLIAEFHPVTSGEVGATPAASRDSKDTGADFKDFKDTGVTSQPFRVVALSAFGDSTNDAFTRVPNQPPNTPNTPVPLPGGGTLTPPINPIPAGGGVVSQ